MLTIMVLLMLLISAYNLVINSDTSIHVPSGDIFYSYTLGEFGDVKLAHEDV